MRGYANPSQRRSPMRSRSPARRTVTFGNTEIIPIPRVPGERILRPAAGPISEEQARADGFVPGFGGGRLLNAIRVDAA